MTDQDPICNPPVFDTSLIPSASSFSDPTFNILPFLCQLLKVADNDNIDPVLIPPAEYDMSKHVNFSALTGVGDRRYSDGAILSAAFIKFLPRIITQMEVGRSGGSQIINNYVCDSDGNPIKQSLTTPILTTASQGGNILGYDIPKQDPNQLLTPLSMDEVFTFVQDYMNQQSHQHADAFIQYLKTHYNPSQGWSYSLHSFKNPPFFYVALDHKKNKVTDYSVYLKYYDNVQDYVAKQLSNIGFISSDASIDVRIGATFDNNAICRAFLTPIPNYATLIHDEIASANNNTNAQSFYSATSGQQFTNYGKLSSSINENFDLIAFVNSTKY